MLIPCQTWSRGLGFSHWGLALAIVGLASPAALAIAPPTAQVSPPSPRFTQAAGQSAQPIFDLSPRPIAQAGAAEDTAEDTAIPAPPLPALPEAVPAAIAPERSGIMDLTPDAETDLGVGHLRPSNLGFLETNDWENHPLAYAGWLRSVALPLYVDPGSDPWGWLINGWLIIPDNDPIAIGRDASFSMVQAEPGLYSFPVLALRQDGWFQFQYTPVGAAWAHTDHLNAGAIALTIEPWEDQAETAAQVRFLRHGLSQPLRADPKSDGNLRSLVAANSVIRPLEVNGNWMRVSVTQPAQGCRPLPGSTTQEGWIRWRNEDQSLLVWFEVNDACGT